VTAGTRSFAALLLAALVVTSAAIVAVPATAQSAAPTFTLAAQSPWVAPGSGFVMRFATADVPAGAQVALTVHDAVQSRTAFDDSIDGDSLPPTRDRQTFAFDQLPVDAATGQRVLAYPSTSLGSNGVFPLEVDLRSADDESLAHFVTHVVVAPVGADGASTGGQPLNVAWVWPLQTEPAFVAAPVIVNPTTLADLGPTGRLGRQAAQLAANPDVPLTLAPSPETLDAWTTLAQKTPTLAVGLNQLRSATARNQVLAGPFVPLDLPSLVRSDLQDIVTTSTSTRPSELTRGVSVLEKFLGAHVDPSTALPGPLDATSLSILQNASVRQLVVEGNALTPENEKYTPAHPYEVQTVNGDASSAVTVLATDDGLEKFLTGDQPPALRAAHLLAGLSVVAGEQPSISRGIAIANPANWDADDTFVAAVLAGLRGNPLLRPTTVQGLLAAVPVATTNDQADGTPVYRELAQYSPPAAPVTAAQYASGVQSRDAVAALVGVSDPRTQNADRALATSVAAPWANPPGRVRARQLLASIGSSVADYLGQVQVQPQSTVTITSSKAEIPVSFRNTGEDDITVHLRFDSDRLLFPDGAERDITLPHQHNTTIRVAVETRGSGTAPVTLTVTTPAGLAIGKPTVIKVRSSFVSGVGVFLTVGAVVFLVVWWGWDIQRRRKKRAREHHPTYRLTPRAGQPA
jgi:Family of unknown function (DUF6049)